MPIRPENRGRYPKEWPQISKSIRLRAGNLCEQCGVPNHELGGRGPDGSWYKARVLGCDRSLPKEGEWSWCDAAGDQHPLHLRIVRIVLTVAHLDHTPENCDPENLRAWCQRCHNIYDAPMRRAGIKARARAALGMEELPL